MMEFYHVLKMECDCKSDSTYCWDEVPLFLEEGETKELGIKTLEKWGWDLSEPDYHVCPYCNKGLKMDDVLPSRLRRVK